MLSTELENMWMRIAKTTVIGNEIPLKFLFHVFISQYFKNTLIKFGSSYKDIRTSMIWIAPSRTGKGEAIKVLEEFCKQAKIKFGVVTTTTDAGILGTVNGKIEDKNLEKGLRNPTDTYQKKDGTNIKWEDPVEKGDIFNYDIVTFREAKMLLSKTDYTENMLTILQEALDYPGTIRKKLASKYEISGTSTASIIGTSLYIREIKEVLLYQGFFQRVIIYINDVNIRQRLDLNKKILGKYNEENHISKADMESYYRVFFNLLSKVNREPRNITIDKAALDLIEKNIEEFTEAISEDYSGNELEILLTFLTGIEDNYIKLATHYAILDNSDRVYLRHVIQAKPLVRVTVHSLMLKLLERVKIERESTAKIMTIGNEEIRIYIAKFIKENKEQLSKTLLIEKIYNSNYMKKNGVKRNRIIYAINDLINRNIIKVEAITTEAGMYKKQLLPVEENYEDLNNKLKEDDETLKAEEKKLKEEQTFESIDNIL